MKGFFPKNIRPRIKVLATFPAILISIGVGAVWGLDRIEQHVKSDLASTVRTVLGITQAALRFWADEKKIDLLSFTKIQGLKEAVFELKKEKELGPSNRRRVSESENKISALLEPILTPQGYLDFLFVDQSGKVVASSISEQDRVKRVLDSNREVIGKAFDGRFSIGSPFDENPHGTTVPAMVSAGLLNGNENARIAFLLLMDPTKDFTRVTRLGRIGESGETYAFDGSGRMVTESRFDRHLKQAGLIRQNQQGLFTVEVRDPGVNLVEGQTPRLPRDQQPLTRMAASALRGEDGVDVEGYRDYRGVPVVGAWLWDPTLEIGLSTEIDVAEAYEPVRTMRVLVLFIFGIAVLGGLIISLALWQNSRALEDAVLSRDEFLSVASHELKTPLTALKMQTQILQKFSQQKGEETGFKTRFPRMLEICNEQVDRLVQLITSLLDLSRIRAGKFEITRERFDLSKLVLVVMERFEEQAKLVGSKLSLSGSTSITGLWDYEKLDQVVTNLISNALKYGAGKPVEIEIFTRDGNACLTVIDHGVGIKETELQRLFQAFERVGETKSVSGLGLGLYISRQIVEAHGGTIQVASKLGEGSTFLVSLPVDQPAEAGASDLKTPA